MRVGRALGAALLACAGLGAAAAAAPTTGGELCPAPAGAAEAGRAQQDLARGVALETSGDARAALAAYESALAAARDGGDPWLVALARANRARAAIEAGELAGVAAELDALASAAEGFQGRPERSRLLIHVARSQALLGEARGTGLAPAARSFERAAELAAADGKPRQRSYALGYRGELAEREGRDAQAQELTSQAILAGLEADADDALWRWQWQQGRLARRAGRDADAVAAYRQAVATLGELRRQAAPAVATAPGAGGSVEDLYLQLVDLLLARARDARDPAAQQALLAEARDTLEAQKAEELRDYFQDECLAAQRKTTPEEIPGTVVVYPIVLPDRVEILVGGGGTLERHVSPVDRETLTREVLEFRSKLARRTTREYQRHAEQLYEWLIRPIDAAIRAREPETVVFVPDGPLRTIPFSALMEPGSRHFLIERYPIAIVPSLTLTEPRPIAGGGARLLAAGLSVSVEGYPALPSVSDEIESVHDSFPGRTLLNDDFRIAAFEDEVESKPFGIVHIASHGEFSDDPSQSFLLAYDGRLSMNELASTVATTRFRQEQPLELLTLSACETAAGNERAGLGLAGIALRAGARSALATLWAVNDEASANLVTEFYTELGSGEHSRAQALQQAQLKLLAHRGFRHPAFWSPFVLISSWL